MAFTIYPGYDFSVHETPTRAKLEQMLSGASIYGIDISNIDATLVGIKINNENSDVSTPGEGWIWKDSQNNLWVKSRFGRLRLRRSNWGGWETMRAWQGPNQSAGIWASDPTKPIGARGHIGCSQDTKSTSTVFFINTGANDNTVTFVLVDTGYSGSPCRILGRGGLLGASRTSLRQGTPDLFANAGTSTEPNLADWPAGTIAAYRGIVTRQFTNWTGFGLVWYFGASIQEQ